MFSLPIYSDRKLLTAFEYGVVLATVALERKVPLTPELVKKMEDIILEEFRSKDWKTLNTEMIPNILASFETK